MKKTYTCDHMTKRSEEEKKALTTRLNRIQGQIVGVKKMVDEDRYCPDILIQLAAIQAAVKSLSTHLLDEHMHSCVKKNLKGVKEEDIQEVIDLFKRYK